jgi:hypothetical protein
MAKHRAVVDWKVNLHREVHYLRNQWYCFVKPSLKRLLRGESEPWRKYWRS